MRKFLRVTLTILTITAMILTILYVHSVPTTTIYVNPKNSYPLVGLSFTVDIKISDVTNLNAWQLQLIFNPVILNCESITVPPDNIFGSSIWFPPPKINNALGNILAFCALEGAFGVDGSGILCQIEFSCKTPGISSLNIINEMQPTGTYLQDPEYNPIPFEAIDGVTEVDGPGFEENEFNVTQNSKTYRIIVFSNSTITSFNYNQTLKTITFNISGPDGTPGSSSVAVSKELLNGTLAVLVEGTQIYYTLSENTTHNFLHFTYLHSMKSVKIWLTMIADVNGDRKVDMRDLFLVILAFGTGPGQPGWNPICDINQDGKVDMKDIFIVILEYGKWGEF